MTVTDKPAQGKFHWVEANYRRADLTIFAARFYVPAEQQCPPTAEDDSGTLGNLVEGTCIEVNKGCFIATAAFGSELDARVELLRHFRDDILLQSDLRDGFARVLDWYYHFSPPIAAAMVKKRAFKLLLRWVLVYPALIFAETFVALLVFTHKEWYGVECS